MAKRMFSTKITSSSQFLMMAQSAQNLYFHLGMNADDDGFVEHFTIMRMTESKPDDLNVLQVRKFVKVFDDRVLIIRDWKVNNYIRSDRYTPSKYLQIYKNELKLIAKESQNTGMTNDNQMVDADKIRLDKIRLELPKGKRITSEYGNPEINKVLNTLKEKFSLSKLDGSDKENRRYANLAIKKFGDDLPKIIEAAAGNDFWKNKISQVKDIYYNGVKILQLKKGGIKSIDLSAFVK